MRFTNNAKLDPASGLVSMLSLATGLLEIRDLGHLSVGLNQLDEAMHRQHSTSQGDGHTGNRGCLDRMSDDQAEQDAEFVW